MINKGKSVAGYIKIIKEDGNKKKFRRVIVPVITEWFLYHGANTQGQEDKKCK